MKKILFFLMGMAGFVSTTAARTTLSIPAQSASTTYQVGDVYNQDGVQGVVIEVDGTGKHGTIMSLSSVNAMWCSNKDLLFETNAFYEDNGEKNTKLIFDYIEQNGKSWEDFPLFKWVKSLGEGWYIPSKEEAYNAWITMNNGATHYPIMKVSAKKSAIAQFYKKNMKPYGADLLIDTRFYVGTYAPFMWFTSTEADGGAALAMGFGADFKSQISLAFGTLPIKKNAPKAANVRSRAFHKF